MKTKVSFLKFEVISTIVIFITGVLFHFLFKWSNSNIFVGAFSPVNESVWEHLKLIYFPMLITSLVGLSLFSHAYPNYLWVRLKSILLSLAFVVVFFYTYTGIIGRSFVILDIGSFFLAIFLGEYYSYKYMDGNTKSYTLFSLFFLILLGIIFVLFTYFPLHIELFRDPISKMFGIIK